MITFNLPQRLTTWLTERALDVIESRPPDFIIGKGKTDTDRDYLCRWWVIPRNRLFNIYLHLVRKSDDDRALHDHPWINASIVLEGEYDEVTPKGTFRRTAGSVVLRRAKALHRLVLPSNGEHGEFAMTFFITGPKIRNWGFACPKGWVPWQKFVSARDEGEVGPGCGD